MPSIAKQTKEGAEALSLVPEGLHPVATFPPYQSTRKYPAISVIWLEKDIEPEVRSTTLKQKKGMYGLWTKQWRQMNLRRIHLRRDRILQAIFSNEKGRKFDKLREKIKNKRNDIFCSQNRNRIKKNQGNLQYNKPKESLFTRFKNLLKPVTNFIIGERRNSYRKPQSFKCKVDKLNSSPTFGFRTLVTIIEDEPCVPGVSCTIDGHKTKRNVSNDLSREPKNKSNLIKRENQNKMRQANKSENEIDVRKKHKIEFKPSEKFEWTDSGFEYIARRKRHAKEKISASQPYCNVALASSEELCRNKMP